MNNYRWVLGGMICLWLSVLLSGTIIFASPPTTLKTENTAPLFLKGQEFFRKGDFERAVQYWEQAVAKFVSVKDVGRQMDTLIHLSLAYQSLGAYQQAINTLQKAQSLLEHYNHPDYRAMVLSGLGDLYLLTRQVDKAQPLLEQGVTEARKGKHPMILANALNNLGNGFVTRKEYEKAEVVYRECIQLARQEKDISLQVKALINRIRVLMWNNRLTEAGTVLESALSTLRKLPNSHQKAFNLISIGMTARNIQQQMNQKGSSESRLVLMAYEVLNEAVKIAQNLQDFRLVSHAYGILGQLYEDERRYSEAMRLTRSALFFAQQSSSPEILYRWQWQMGRLSKAQGQLEEAIVFYRNAVNNLQSVRRELVNGYRNVQGSFRDTIAPVYFGLADLLLRRAETSTDEQFIKKDLLEARETIETLKTAELEDYFQDECVTAVQSKNVQLDRVAPHSAVLYPIPLPDRVALLLSLPGGMKQITVPVPSHKLDKTVHQFRRQLQRRTTHRYIRYSKQLYHWLIRPIEADLTAHNVDTLVIVPDGKLRTIPFAALYENKQFLIQKYALATTPSLTLTDPRVLKRENIQILINGLSEGVQGFPPLPNVPGEIQSIQEITGGKVLRDQKYSASNVDREVRNNAYSIVHIASHGQFDADPEKTFLLTYESKLTMDHLSNIMGLSQFREEPVELLTLSACQTAVGDDRAALGLAGVAIKAGARSALATLWFVDDVSTSLLVTEFYRQLQNPDVSKAKALQAAQTRLLKERQHRHPAYWAPFLLIGNWL